MEKDDKGSTMIRMGVSGWMFLLVPACPGCPGSKAVKRSLLLLFPDVDSYAVKFYHIKTASYHEKFHWGPSVFIRIHLFLDQWMYSPYYKLVFTIGKLLFAFTALCCWLAVISGNKNIISCNIPRWLLQDFGRKCYKFQSRELTEHLNIAQYLIWRCLH